MTVERKGGRRLHGVKRASRVSEVRDAGSLIESFLGRSVDDPGLRRKSRRLMFLFALFAVLVGTQVSVTLRIRALGYQSLDLAGLIRKLDQEALELRAAVTRESGTAVIASRARELGLREPRPGQVRKLEE